MKRFNPVLKAKVKMNIQRLLFEAEQSSALERPVFTELQNMNTSMSDTGESSYFNIAKVYENISNN